MPKSAPIVTAGRPPFGRLRAVRPATNVGVPPVIV